jgi:hypothetical protein
VRRAPPPEACRVLRRTRRDRARPGKALRVSRYLGVAGDPRHVRFSVWNEDGVAEAAVSLDEDETARLLDFLGQPRPQAPAPSRRSRLDARLLNG